ncbi:alpha/beta hydrolase [uncultured Lactobacillus sp.]|uniref:alpha/beta hydrolase n=1 Tax=uncultured Lactobacillus sp. TaxID=153152 RepID=UPI0025F646E0|nr:alpha/beta hydrolase [uncultured Lactobacillus sp.]
MEKKNQKRSKSSRLVKILGGLLAVLAMALAGAGYYFFNIAVVPGKKSFVTNGTVKLTKSTPQYKQKLWYKQVTKQHWQLRSAKNNYLLQANYIPAKNSAKTVIILHGYMSNKENMGAYAQLFHSLGYNTLLPDAEAHGQSQGKYVGYGWLEKNDVKKWAEQVIKKNGQKSKIVIFGVSMGGATTMMTSGLKLPKQVKCFIEDCGYTNAKNEIEHEAKVLYNMPAFPRFPLVEILSGITKLKASYFLAQVSSLAQLKKNTRPMLFIHGSKDTFVPTEMVYKNYRASRGPKQLLIVRGAQHAKSYEHNPALYARTVKQFLAKYVK